MAHVGGPTAQAGYPGPRTPLQNERQEQKRDLASWWKNFKRSDKKPVEPQAPLGIFGIPLQQSIRYANVAISLINDEGHSYIYGYVPIVVAKCGVFLKEKATETEGIFRLAGSEKRIKELKVAFDSPDRFGKGLDWTGYTVHDAANILRRYFNQLPEPIIPLDFYDRFREPLRNHQAQAVGQIEAQSPSVGHFDADSAILEYQKLITELPPLNRQLLLYILDLLAVFASKSDLNKMTTPNLAAIFQPGILSHPNHDMAPPEYRLSQDVLIFLIDNQDSFLIGMSGTEADAQTVKDVQSGTPPKVPGSPATPSRSKTIIGRSSSNASTRAESLRKTADLRRNVSVSSKQSKLSENGPTPVGMSPSGSVHRSNTVPSRRDGSSAHSPRITRERLGDAASPKPDSPATLTDDNRTRQESLQSTPIALAVPQFPAAADVTSLSSGEASGAIGSDASSATTRDYQTPKRDTTPLLAAPARPDHGTERTTAQTPSTSPGRFLDLFKQSPMSGDEARRPNKLQKRRVPGTSISSAQSSTHSLGHDESQDAALKAPVAAVTSGGVADTHGEAAGLSSTMPGQPIEAVGEPPAAFQPTTGAMLAAPPRNLSADHGQGGLRPQISPAHSYRSATESDADMVGDDMPKEAAGASGAGKEKKRHRWRFSRSQNKFEPGSPPASGSNNNSMSTAMNTNPLGTMTAKEQATSRSTVGSSGARKSFQDPTPLVASATDPATGSLAQGNTFSSSSTGGDQAVFSDSEREKRGGGALSWIRGKMGGNKDVDKRSRTPERSGMPVRGKSIEALRGGEETAATPTTATTTMSPAAQQTTAHPGAVVAAQVAAGSSASPSAPAPAPPSPKGRQSEAEAEADEGVFSTPPIGPMSSTTDVVEAGSNGADLENGTGKTGA